MNYLSGAQKQRPNELLWYLGSDKKVYLSHLNCEAWPLPCISYCIEKPLKIASMLLILTAASRQMAGSRALYT